MSKADDAIEFLRRAGTSTAAEIAAAIGIAAKNVHSNLGGAIASGGIVVVDEQRPGQPSVRRYRLGPNGADWRAWKPQKKTIVPRPGSQHGGLPSGTTADEARDFNRRAASSPEAAPAPAPAAPATETRRAPDDAPASTPRLRITIDDGAQLCLSIGSARHQLTQAQTEALGDFMASTEALWSRRLDNRSDRHAG